MLKRLLTLEVKIRPLLLLGVFITILLGLGLSTVVYETVFNGQEDSLKQRISTIGTLLSSLPLENLHGDASDKATTTYQSLKQTLVYTHTINSDTRFIYLMGKRGDTIFFYADSEPEQNFVEYSQPGQVYTEANSEIKKVFDTGAPTVVFYSDRWGNWVSGFAPVYNANHTKVIAVSGMDIDYTEYQRIVFVYTSMPALVALGFASLLFFLWLLSKREEEMLTVRAQILAIAAHDLRSPIISIKWAAEALSATKEQMSEASMKKARMIQVTCESVLDSISELLNVAASNNVFAKLKKAQIPLITLINGAVDPLSLSLTEYKIKLDITDACRTAQVNVEMDRMRRVFTNLLSNAIKYSKPETTITIDAKRQKDRLIITIQDQGMGIPKTEQSKVFNGYFRASNARDSSIKGNGVGLYYSKKVVEAHGGRMYLESNVGKGTTIFIDLPYTEPVPMPSEVKKI
jgi:signal transduction histidine kinase